MTLKSGKKMDLLSAKMIFFETNLAKIIADPKCACQELSNDVSHVYVSSSSDNPFTIVNTGLDLVDCEG